MMDVKDIACLSAIFEAILPYLTLSISRNTESGLIIFGSVSGFLGINEKFMMAGKECKSSISISFFKGLQEIP